VGQQRLSAKGSHSIFIIFPGAKQNIIYKT